MTPTPTNPAEAPVKVSSLADQSAALESLEKSLTPTDEAPAEDSAAPNVDVLKADASAEFFSDPSAALLQEEVIKAQPEAFMALAAFTAEATDGLQKGLATVDKKLDEFIKLMVQQSRNHLQTIGELQKSLMEQQDLIKAMGAAPAETFRSTDPTAAELAKARKETAAPTGLEIPEKFVTDFMEKAVREGRLNPIEVAKYESSKQVPDLLKATLQGQWNLAKAAQLQ